MALKEIMAELENTKDELLDDIILFFENSEKEITTSIIQRKCQIGYNRANRIIRQMKTALIEKRNDLKRELLNPILTGGKSKISIPDYSEKVSLIEKRLSEIKAISNC
jgi:DNA segregation ATPase FtsK/SpoIIIE-like protein